MTNLYRKRLIPLECVHLKDDEILFQDEERIITRWTTLRPKSEFSHGVSYYCLSEGWKISKFYKDNQELAYIYCDIIDSTYDKTTDSYTFTDLLADVILYNDGTIHVVDLDELAEACEQNIISNHMLVTALYRLDKLLSIIYNGKFQNYINFLGMHE